MQTLNEVSYNIIGNLYFEIPLKTYFLELWSTHNGDKFIVIPIDYNIAENIKIQFGFVSPKENNTNTRIYYTKK